MTCAINFWIGSFGTFVPKHWTSAVRVGSDIRIPAEVSLPTCRIPARIGGMAFAKKTGRRVRSGDNDGSDETARHSAGFAEAPQALSVVILLVTFNLWRRLLLQAESGAICCVSLGRQ